MNRIFVAGIGAFVQFILAFGDYPLLVGYFDRSQQTVRAFGANLSLGSGYYFQERRYISEGGYNTFITPIVYGKEKFFHAVSISDSLGKEFLIISDDKKGQQLYDHLMHTYDLPLLAEWGEPLYKYFFDNAYIVENTRCAYEGDVPVIPYKGNDVLISSLKVISINITEEVLKEGVSTLLQNGTIQISPNRQRSLQFSNMDSYFKEYGHTLVENLSRDIVPLTKLDGEAHDFTLKKMRLYPQQLAQINGDVRLLENGRYAILNHGMGTGKTISAASICESYFVRKWLRGDSRRTLEDAYKDIDTIKYRNIIMCPSHLVAKWVSELQEQIPYAHVEAITDFKQLLQIRAGGRKRTKKEFFVMSKDFCKLSYQSVPSPSKMRDGRLKYKVCADCGSSYMTPGHTCPECGSRDYQLRNSVFTGSGMVCPNCNQILVPNRRVDLSSGAEKVETLDYGSFTGQRGDNSNCYYCEEELWQPHVRNLGDSKSSKWVRATHYANKTHKGKKTIWAHKDYIDMYFAERVGETPLSVIEGTGARKYAPSQFIKRYLRGYFDIAIFDEIQDLKSGFTGQGHAMHCLIKASKKQLAMTGTIAGGYANHLFYTLYRLDPKRMRDKGFSYGSEMRFSELYGNVEKAYEFDGSVRADGTYNASCKGRQVSSPKVKPGISPMIFMDFLLDKTTFLDLSDMSKYLPPLKETVVSVRSQKVSEHKMMSSYRSIIERLKDSSRQKGHGMAVLSQMLQFSLSYPDKPYGVSDILSPLDGSVITEVDSYAELSRDDELSSKEQELIEIIRSEQSENRNVFVFAEYTGSPETCVTYRLKMLIEKHCNLKGKVEVLESSSPQATKREEWMHKKAKQGIKVFITNPRCVATGLDFCFTEGGVEYNYPTIIFYQMGYSLFTVWQASRRHFRLNQRKECRTYYMAWAGTAQEAAISLIAEKQAATSAIQGKFSAEGLAAMANGVDARMKLAAALSDMDSISGNGLQEMFDVLAEDASDDGFGNYKAMALLSELLKGDIPKESFDTTKVGVDLFSLMGVATEPKTEKKTVATQTVVVTAETAFSMTKLSFSTKKENRRSMSGQMSLF